MTVYEVSFEYNNFRTEKIFDSEEKAKNYMKEKGYYNATDSIRGLYYKNMGVDYCHGCITEIDVE